MKAKKWLMLVLALAVALTCLAGCGGKGGNDEVATGSAITYNGDDIYPIQCEDTLRYWMGLDVGTAQTVENFGDTPLAKKLEENTGIKIAYEHPTQGQGDEQFQLLLAGDNLPDIVGYNWISYPGGPQAAINEGYIYNLNDIIDKYAPALSKVLSENPDWDKEIKDDNGDYYAFPFMMEEGILQVAFGPIWRGDWLEKAGLDVPETIDEWENALTVFKNQFGATEPLTGTWDTVLKIESAYGIWDGFYLNGDKVVFGPAEPAYKDVLAKLHDWYEKGILDSDIAVNDSSAVNTKMTTGKSGVTFGWAGSGLGAYVKANEGNPNYKLVGSRYPVITKGETPEYSYVSGTVNMGVSVSISKNCINPELAARYLDYGFTEEGHNLYNFGIEGESYNWVEKDGEQYPGYTDIILNNPDGLSITAAMGRYIRASYSGPFVQDTHYIEQYYQMQEQKDAQKEWGVTNMNDHLFPQISVAADVSDRDADIMTNVGTYREELTLKFITGEKSLDEFDEYIDQLKAYGIEEAIQNRQDAYDRYLTK